METAVAKCLIAAARKAEGLALRKKLEKQKNLAIKITTLAALEDKVAQEIPDCLVLAVETPKQIPLRLIESIQQQDDQLPILVFSQAKEVGEVVALMKQGIHDYLISPADGSRLSLAIENACRMYQLTQRVFLLENQLGGQTKLEGLLGVSAPMQIIFQTIQNVAKTSATVLVTGESGTGKELAAKAIHHLSPRHGRRFIDINCGAIPRELLENELFGHERGAFTGADRRYQGCCERADGGTLFLDEISEMSLDLQVKLLRFLQERSFTRIGGTETIPVDVRIVAATNKNLTQCIRQGTFREDLFYRLNVVPIALPPLREKKEDIPLLAKYFLEKYAHKNEKPFLGFHREAMEALLGYAWPGNVRELENTIERAIVLFNDTQIKRSHLPGPLQKEGREAAKHPAVKWPAKLSGRRILPLEWVERYAIEQALKVCVGNVAETAERLQIGQATLYRKIKQYGIRL